MHVRRPRLDYESNATGLDRNGSARSWSRPASLAPRPWADQPAHLEWTAGLRSDRGRHRSVGARAGASHAHHRAQRRQGRDRAPRAPHGSRHRPRSRRALRGSDLSELGGERLDRHAAGRIVRRIARRAGITDASAPTHCGTRSSPPRSTPVSRCATCKKPPATPTRAPPYVKTALGSPSIGTLPTSSRRSSPAQRDDQHHVRSGVA